MITVNGITEQTSEYYENRNTIDTYQYVICRCTGIRRGEPCPLLLRLLTGLLH